MAAKYTMRSSNRLKGSGEKSLVAPTIACNRPGHDSVFTVFADPRRRAAVFRPRRLACRAELLRAGRRGGGRNQWELRLYLRLRGIEPAGCRRRRSFSEKNVVGLQATRVRANYLTLPSRKTKVCISNTGSRITQTLGA